MNSREKVAEIIRKSGLSLQEFAEGFSHHARDVDPGIYNSSGIQHSTRQAGTNTDILPLLYHTDSIISALDELEHPPPYIVDSIINNSSVNWNDFTSILDYSYRCYLQYQYQTKTSRFLDDFLTSLAGMSYTHSFDIVLGRSFLQNLRISSSIKALDSPVEYADQLNVSRMIQIGTRCTEIVEIFEGFSGLVILGFITLSKIIAMSSPRFERFTNFLRDEVEQGSFLVQTIKTINIDIRLLLRFGREFPPSLQKYLPDGVGGDDAGSNDAGSGNSSGDVSG